MPKICKVDGCDNPVWSTKAGYCKFHMYKARISTKKKREYKYTREKQKSLKKAIKPISDKQAKKLQLYEQGKREKEKQLKEQNQWCCIFCGQSFKEDDSIDWHHMFGRNGDLVYDMRFVFPSHTYCHISIYHGSSYDVLSSQRWYSEFLERCKEIDIKIYQKELRKRDKA